MFIESQVEQTRRIETVKNQNEKRELLNNLSKRLNEIKTNTHRTMQFGDNWAKRNCSTTYEINNYLTREQEYALRMENMLRETVSVYGALHAFDGAMTAETYNALMDEFKNNFNEILKTLNVKGHILTLFKDGQFVGTKMFDDPVRMKLWFDKHIKYDMNKFRNPITVPPEYAGSILAEQDWCTNPEEFFSKLKAQS